MFSLEVPFQCIEISENSIFNKLFHRMEFKIGLSVECISQSNFKCKSAEDLSGFAHRIELPRAQYLKCKIV